MTLARRRTFIALAGAVSLALTVGLSGCSSDSGAMETAAAAEAQGPAAPAQATDAPVRVGVAEFANVIASPDVTIVDVRTPQEFAEGHIEGAVNIPVELPDFMDRVSELDPSGTYAVYCRSGNRSQPAVAGMASVGITSIFELESGTTGWASEGQPLVQ
jgi:rhodanese-related sulfurtransferase